MNLNIVGSGQKVEVSEVAFGREFNEALVHQVVIAYQAAGRQGTQKQKTRAEVSGGGAKPFRQKGTGRARAGTSSSPIWVGGGRAFAARPRSYAQKVNKKMYRGALQCIWSELVRQDRLVIVDSFDVEAPKTKAFISKLKTLELSNVLVVADAITENLFLSSRNVPHVSLSDVEGLDPVSLVAHDKVLVTVAALKKVEEALV